MAAIINLSISKDNIAVILNTLTKKGEKYFKLTISVNGETKVFRHEGKPDTLQNVSAYPTQSKKDREAKKPKRYRDNGRVVWTDGSIKKAEAPNEDSQNVEFNANFNNLVEKNWEHQKTKL